MPQVNLSLQKGSWYSKIFMVIKSGGCHNGNPFFVQMHTMALIWLTLNSKVIFVAMIPVIVKKINAIKLNLYRSACNFTDQHNQDNHI